ncbi:glycoside hydrolase family 2 protein [Chitinophaga polysaccharea]|uniref:beta-galactosidase GalB n=1 Tax=Chitinophaga polysaccharea TaxID=1293035 RepID=UPI001454F625|nr:beta-galactosidase GalB [Chitinophaga polysaccharea]NLR60364.1 glycoside hydrolase family 2 protein [Chitinophaga polysaccharea]
MNKRIAFRLVLSGWLYLLTTSTFAQAPASITRMGTTNTHLFDDGWLFSRLGLQADGSRKEEPAHLEEEHLADGNWQQLSLPHDWAITGPFRIELDGNSGKLPWKGIGWYRKHFNIPAADAGKRIFVDLDGAMAYAKIWVNGQYVGTWPYGYNSFRMDITPYLHVGKENVIAVRLDTESWDSRWYPGAGIYRHVWLVKTNEVHVAHWGTFITTPMVTDKAASVEVKVTVDNQGASPVKALVHTDIYELDIHNKPSKKIMATLPAAITIAAGNNAMAQATANIVAPKRWSIETPHRYLAQTIVTVNNKTVDTYNTAFGIRTIAFTPRDGFQLNGKRVDIKGVCNHHDLGALGAAINKSALTRQLKILRAMGCNAIRTSHNPPAPELLELADQLGFLVWDEAFDAWKHGKRKNDYNKLFPDWRERDLQALVHRDRNHPSVIIWSIGNEVMDQRDVAITKELADIVRKEDSTRPVSNAYNDPDGGRESGAAMALGLMGVNYFFSEQAKWDADPRYKDMPTMGSETSSCVSTRGEYFFDGDYKNWQVSSYDNAKPGWGCTPDEQFRTNAKYPHLLGEFVWTGFDYLGEPTPYNSDETNLLNFRNDPNKRAELEKALEALRKNNPPSRSSYFGIVDLCGFPKDRFYSYQAHWRADHPMAHLLPHWNWPERIDSIVPVHVYTSGDEAELFLNGKSLGRKVKQPGVDFRLVWNDVKYTPGELKVVAYKDGKPWATDVIKTAGSAVKLSLQPESKSVVNDGDDLCYITLRVQDKDGIMVPRSHPLVKFSIEGPGEIVATDNGDPTSFVSFQSNDRPAFNGMAQVIVKAKKGAKGKLVVKAVSEGLSPAVVVVGIK